MEKDLKIKLNIKSIIRFEQLTNKSFYEIDSLTDDFIKLLYCIVLVNNDFVFSYDDFLDILKTNNKIGKDIMNKFQKLNQLNEQFIDKIKTAIEPEIKKETEPIKENKINYIKDIASMLIVQLGLDANYVLYDMEVIDIKMYYDAYITKIKNEENINIINLTYNRLNTWYSVICQVGAEKLNNPTKLYSFPWEKEELEKEVKKHQINKSEFDDIMKNQMAGLIENINKTKEIN